MEKPCGDSATLPQTSLHPRVVWGVEKTDKGTPVQGPRNGSGSVKGNTGRREKGGAPKPAHGREPRGLHSLGAVPAGRARKNTDPPGRPPGTPGRRAVARKMDGSGIDRELQVSRRQRMTRKRTRGRGCACARAPRAPRTRTCVQTAWHWLSPSGCSVDSGWRSVDAGRPGPRCIESSLWCASSSQG